MDRNVLEQAIFYESPYLATYPDAASAVEQGTFNCGREHWDKVGKEKGYESVWVIPVDIDHKMYFLHYPDAKKLVDSGKDPDIDSAAAHFRRYGNRNGHHYFMRDSTLSSRYEGLPDNQRPDVDKIREFENETNIKHVPCSRDVVPGEVRGINKIVVLSTFFNPNRYSKPHQNMLHFREEMSKFGVDLRFVELAFDNDPFVIEDAMLQVRGNREDNQLWQKERLLNIALDEINDADAIGWFDCDILFQNRNWFREAQDALCQYTWCQPFTGSWFTERDGTLTHLKNSCAWYMHNMPQYALALNKAHPGFAWLSRADWIKENKFCDTNITGGGDALMAKAFSDAPLYIEKYLNIEWLDDINVWASKARLNGGRHIGTVSGDIIHLYHGSRDNRLYLLRWHYLSHFNFDPRTDIEIDPETKLWKWTTDAKLHKPEMVRRVKGYFADRKEDS